MPRGRWLSSRPSRPDPVDGDARHPFSVGAVGASRRTPERCAAGSPALSLQAGRLRPSPTRPVAHPASGRRWASSRSLPPLRRRRLSRTRHVVPAGWLWFIAAFGCLFGLRFAIDARATRDLRPLRLRRAHGPRRRPDDRLLRGDRTRRPSGRRAARPHSSSPGSARPATRRAATSRGSPGSASGLCWR